MCIRISLLFFFFLSLAPLTVDIEVDCSTQVSLQVVKIDGCAHVDARVCALDRFHHQDTILTDDGVSLQVEGQGQEEGTGDVG